ncbi:MAG: translation initiation factor [Patescibacteria group bacterium]|nr:translation initiation factor [Patescibacteria group bacterium]
MSRINNQINVATVRVIDEDGQNIGILPIGEALRLSTEKGVDLVEITPGAKPPVCKLQDYNKYLYDQKVKTKKAKGKKSELKEFVFGPHIGEGDLRIRIDRGIKFLENGNLVKYTVQFKGREIMYPEIGETKLKIVESELSEVARVENPLKLTGKLLTITFVAKKSK